MSKKMVIMRYIYYIISLVSLKKFYKIYFTKVSLKTGSFETSLQFQLELLDECWVEPMKNSCMFNALIKSKEMVEL